MAKSMSMTTTVIGGIMLAEMAPECPRLHHGVMAIDQGVEYGVEFVCRICGTRIYPNKPELIPESEISSEAGRPRKLPKYSGPKQLEEYSKPRNLPDICEKCGRPNARRRDGRICPECRKG